MQGRVRRSRDVRANHRPLGHPFNSDRPRNAISGVCSNRAESGTAFANLSIPIGCAPSVDLHQRGKHGGARNSANRTSDGLTRQQAELLCDAALTAIAIGRALNRHITVHWQAIGTPDHRAATATTAFLKYFREWLGGGTAYIWTRENGDGKGSHLHILAHMPAGRCMNGARSRRWLERITGQPYRRGTIRTTRIGGASDPDGPAYAANLRAVVAYILKGVAADTAMALGIAHSPGGRIIGKRCGTSRNVGAKARQNHG